MIAIHNSRSGFHPRWVDYCQKNSIPYKLLDCYATNLIEQLHDCRALMWHHSQNDPKALLSAKPILFALEQAGIKVFPDFNTNWHFDDKVGQKYLLEAIHAPLVPSYVFFDKIEALNWAKKTIYPKVFKLRGGAGSLNVKLVNNIDDANRIINKSFGKGLKPFDAFGHVKETLRKYLLGKVLLLDLFKAIFRLFYPPEFAKVMGREYGYVYFQDFIPDNDHDIRVIVIYNRAFAIKRLVRKNDFRASGSGNILYEKELFDSQTLKLSFQIHNKLKSQCTAMDFVYDNGVRKIVEISFGFVPEGYVNCPGYWDQTLTWHEGVFNPYGWMVEELMK